MRYKILLSKLAKKDLRNILLSLKEKTENLNLILQQQSEIIDSVQSLDIFPERHPLYNGKYNKQNLRKMVTKHYIILYRIHNNNVIIVKIFVQGMNI
ncbi:type II toxin-antitoxin system RelE/ParE family toxin [uncultured Veillonella sp.]|uniref:type II toxin-antitoxin system RelE/ParE family toxin n=1 Tax=uncultured Veillonella sp. TaxID=159268 RepID=UPI0028DB7F44|nr:type II toxin-antitoxin system RelE/ParE family toxin [uncultured Veillonella sp.]